jgi:hypothetical protein
MPITQGASFIIISIALVAYMVAISYSLWHEDYG